MTATVEISDVSANEWRNLRRGFTIIQYPTTAPGVDMAGLRLPTCVCHVLVSNLSSVRSKSRLDDTFLVINNRNKLKLA